jgi:alpha-L-arabinofuranosidase
VKLTGINGAQKAKMIALHGATFEATNSIHDPEAIHPIESTVSVPSGTWGHSVPALTIEVIDLPLR